MLATGEVRLDGGGQVAGRTSAGSCDAVGRGLTTAGRALIHTVTTPVLALGATAIKASLDFESTFTSVRKTVDATEAEFESLAASSKAMSTQIAASTGEINEVMATAGQLGIYKNYLADFSRTMIDLGNSTDIVANEAASTLAKFANITNMDQSLFGNLGATLVDLGNKFATTESSIMEMSLRLAGGGPSGGAVRGADSGLCRGAVVGRHRGRNGRLGVFQGAGQDGGGRGPPAARRWRTSPACPA